MTPTALAALWQRAPLPRNTRPPTPQHRDTGDEQDTQAFRALTHEELREARANSDSGGGARW